MLVVKVGGAVGIDLDALVEDLAGLLEGGERLVLVHGGSHETNVISEKLGHPPRFVTSVSGFQSRYTDRETLDIFTMVYAGKVNKLLVEKLQARGVNAVGLSGLDGAVCQGTRKATVRIVEGGKRKVLRDDHTGRPEKINRKLLDLLLDAGFLPVLTPPILSYEGVAVNVDGDRMAALLASELGAETLVILSNVPGLLKDPNDESTLIESVRRDRLEQGMQYAEGRMKKKIMGVMEAVGSGVKRVILGDARRPGPISAALKGQGTVIE